MTRIRVGVASVHVFKKKSVEAGGSQLPVSEVRLCLRCRLEPLPPCPQAPFFWSGGPESCSHAAHPLSAPHLVLFHYPAQDGPFPARPWWPSLLQGPVLPRGCCVLCGLLPDCPPAPARGSVVSGTRAPLSGVTRCPSPVTALLSHAVPVPSVSGQVGTHVDSSRTRRGARGAGIALEGACAGENCSEPPPVWLDSIFHTPALSLRGGVDPAC